MEKFEFKGLEIINESFETRTSWGHISKLYDEKGFCIGYNKSYYYNRTWETFTYQSSAMCCIADCKHDLENQAITNFKNENNVKRLTKDKKEQVLKDLQENNELYKKCVEFYNALYHNTNEFTKRYYQS